MSFIVTRQLHKSFGNVNALTDINLSIRANSLFGLIGPDGAGKTTLFRILTTLMIPDKGSAFVNGYDVVRDYKKIRNFTGYMAGRFSLYQDLTVEENLSFYATLFGTTIKQNYHLIKNVYRYLEPFKDRLAGRLSGGMKQKLALSCALIHNPEILVLDEPTTGVDAVSRKEFWELLKELKRTGMTILVSTSYMDEASLCDEVALMQKGIVMQCDTPEKILSGFGKKLYAIQSSDLHRLITDIRTLEETNSAYLFGQYVHLTLREPYIQDLDSVTKKLTALGHKDIKIFPIQPDIEDSFIAAIESQTMDNEPG
jgi:ABC-2 type transport system ATP-binding protein